MKLWYNGEKKESGFSPCEKKEKLLYNNKLTSSPKKKKSMSILSCGCALSLFFCVLPLDCISVSAAEPGQDAANEMIYGYVNSIPEYVDKVDGDIEAMSIIGSTLGPKFAVYYAGLRLFEEIITSDEWDINVSDGSPNYVTVSGYYKKTNDTNIYIGTLFPCTSNGGTLFEGSSGIKYTLNLSANNGILNDIDITNNIVIGAYGNSFYYQFSRSPFSGYPFGAIAVASGDSYFVDSAMYNNGNKQTYLMTKFNYGTVINNISAQPFNQNDSYSSYILYGCGLWYVPPDNPPDWQAIRELTEPQKEEYFRRYIPDVFNVYYKSVHPELEPYFIHFEPAEETPTDPNPPLNPDGSCCCCNHEIIINNNINNDWVYETQNLPDSPSIDLQIPTADFELLNPSEEIETHGNAIALWFDVFNHLIDSFELQGFILMMCGLALAAFIVWRLG